MSRQGSKILYQINRRDDIEEQKIIILYTNELMRKLDELGGKVRIFQYWEETITQDCSRKMDTNIFLPSKFAKSFDWGS